MWGLGKLQVAVYLGVIMIAGGCADSLVLYPSTQPIEARNATPMKLPNGHGGEIEIWTGKSTPASEPEIFVLTFNGNGDRAEQIVGPSVERWSHRRAEVWAVNYPGYGGSTGPARLKSIAPDALEAYDAIRRRAGERPVFLQGSSLGTTVALYVAANRPCAGLILTNPPPLRQLILGRFGWWNLWLLAGPVALQVPSELSSLTNGPLCHAPAVFILADQDQVVPPQYHRKVVDAYAGPKQVIELRGAGHNTWPDEEEEMRIRKAMEAMMGRKGE